MNIEVVYANKNNQKIFYVEYSDNLTINIAIKKSGILVDFSEINLKKQSVGIYGKVLPLSYIVNPGDRIEIYRPLVIDPKNARWLRAEEKRKKDRLKAFGA